MSEPRPRKVVVVEDDPQICSLICRILEAGGYAVASTTDPRTAHELVRAEAPDLVLSDIAMPEMDGYAVLRTLQSDPDTARYPVVFLTAHKEFSERVRAFRFGVVDFLAKPFTREILLRKIERVLEGLSRRSGVLSVASQDVAMSDVLQEVQRDGRSGMMTIDTATGTQRVLIQAGEIVDGAQPTTETAHVEFQEIDPTREDIATHDPEKLPGPDVKLPSFDSLPQMLREVLIVDDNLFFRRFLHDTLVRAGFTVHQATNGEDGLRLALEHRPWLILTDVRMPGMDGFEFCRRVRSHSLIRQTPLLFLSGWDDYTHRYQGLQLGADDFLSKETPLRELLLRIQLLLKRYADLGAPGRKDEGMQGQIHLIGAPGVLQICHLSHLSGVLLAQDGERRAAVRFREGEIIGAESGNLQGQQAVFAFLAWENGRFHFEPGWPGNDPPLGERFDQLVLEGCRLLDEMRR